jgi:hypothetical protein
MAQMTICTVCVYLVLPAGGGGGGGGGGMADMPWEIDTRTEIQTYKGF